MFGIASMAESAPALALAIAPVSKQLETRTQALRYSPLSLVVVSGSITLPSNVASWIHLLSSIIPTTKYDTS